jgi:hypothetical protein
MILRFTFALKETKLGLPTYHQGYDSIHEAIAEKWPNKIDFRLWVDAGLDGYKIIEILEEELGPNANSYETADGVEHFILNESHLWCDRSGSFYIKDPDDHTHIMMKIF